MTMTNWQITYGMCDGTGPYTAQVQAKDMITAIHKVCEQFGLNNGNLISVVPDVEPLPTFDQWRRDTFPSVDWDTITSRDVTALMIALISYVEYLHGIEGE